MKRKIVLKPIKTSEAKIKIMELFINNISKNQNCSSLQKCLGALFDLISL